MEDKSLRVITIKEQKDGNWIGKMEKDGYMIEVRDVGPETVLLGLITHK